MTIEARRPIHLFVLIGASASAYALSLAGVTGLQSAADGALIDARAPIGAAADRVGSSHDDLDAVVSSAAKTYAGAADRYSALAAQLVEVEAALDALAGRVSKVKGAADALPTRISLPRVTVSAPRTSKPVVHATTGASG
jgi:hypothetical protein